MNKYFLDTSALVKRYHQEEGSDILDRLFEEPDAKFIILLKYGKEYSLKTLDAIQLSVMKLMEVGTIKAIVCADEKFGRVIALEGFQVINPMNSDS